MSGATDAFARTGAALLDLVARQALDTQGAFPPGPAATTLAVAVAYCEAASNAFLVLAEDPGATLDTELRYLGAATQFRRALGVIATRMPGPRGDVTVATLASLAGGAPLNAFFAPDTPAPVSLSGAAQAALDALRRDPLVLAAEGADAVGLLIDTINDGVAVLA